MRRNMSNTDTRNRIGPLTMALTLLFAPAAAARQDSPVPPVQTAPLVLAPVTSSVVFAPDAKVTSVDGATAVLTGGYAGKLFENTVVVGAGGYWLADPRDDVRMFYGGLVIGGRVLGNDQVNLSVRGLAGAGQATIFRDVQLRNVSHHRGHGGRPAATTFHQGIREGFMIVEPEARLSLGIGRRVALHLGVGYRATSTLTEILSGPTGSVGLLFDLAQ
jgi:hypothetical protein